ncbi:hypothetical protein D038_0042B, partial [Vibrio parahaemolyticus IDH02189]
VTGRGIATFLPTFCFF